MRRYVGRHKQAQRARPDFRSSGVREYLVWLITEARLEWFVLEDDEYVPQAPDAAGLLESRAFSGLRLHLAALTAGDTAKVLDALRSNP